jgi:crotonobetainyl-CoA:carnitine CoA-transferase CaiB-like acyl-CoA transferase
MMALEGIHVLDVASMLAGPYCATLLGDLGAEVIKLEGPRGDETRRFGPRRGTDSGVFVGVNRNKRSLRVDLRTEDGQQVLRRLVRWADIIVDNLRPQARAKLRLDYATVRELNPRVIAVSLSSFGPDGPYAGRAGIDPVAQALTGFMAVTGPPGGEPTKAGPPVGDATASLLATADRRPAAHPGPLHRAVLPARHPAAPHGQQHRLVRALQLLPVQGRPVLAPGLLQRQVLRQPVRGPRPAGAGQ